MIKAVAIHGVGTQTRGYSHDARRYLSAGLGQDVRFAEVLWAPLADRAEKAMLASADRAGSTGGPAQRLAVLTLADALYYVTSNQLRHSIYAALDDAVARLDDGPKWIFAHSLGGLIAYDYLRLRPKCTGVRLMTFGCNLGLFHLGQRMRVPHQLRRRGSWFNAFSPPDVLGYPLAFTPGLGHVIDVEAQLGWLRGWTGLAHVRYWDSKKFWHKQVPELLKQTETFA